LRFNLFLFSIIIFIFSNKVLSQNKLVLESKEVSNSSAFKIAIALENTDPISALQFDLNYDDNEFDVLNGHELESLRIQDHQVSFGKPAEGILRVVIFSMSNAVINQNSGTLIGLEFRSKTNPGSYNFEFSNVRFSSSNAENVSQTSENGQITILGAKIEIPTAEINFGDVLLGDYKFRNLIIKNSGNQPLELSSASDILPFKIEDTFPIIIPVNETYVLKLVIDTSTKIEVSKELIFLNNDSDNLRKNQKITLIARVYTTNIIRIGNSNSEKNVPAEIPVYFENIENFTAFQFDLLIPEGLEFIPNSIIKNSDRLDGHDITANLIGNKLRFIGYSSANKNFIGSTGELFKFKLRPLLNEGYFELKMSNGIITNNEQENILTGSESGYFQINAPNLLLNPGQINFENIPLTEIAEQSFTLINNGDAILVIDEAVFDESEIFLDVQFPLTININSSKVVNLKYTPSNLGIFLKSVNFKSNSLNQETIITVKGSVFSPNYLQLEDKEVSVGVNNELSILLKNNDLVRALQFDVELPIGFELKMEDLVTTSRTQGYDVAASEIGGLKYRIIMYSTTTANFMQKGAQPILNFPVFINNDVLPGNYQFNFSNVIIVDENNLDVSSLPLTNGNIKVIEGSNLSIHENIKNILKIYPNPTTDYWKISSSLIIESIELYDIVGRKVFSANPQSEEYEINSSCLSNGVYFLILNNKKVSFRLIKK
jgi:hypothetical protein